MSRATSGQHQALLLYTDGLIEGRRHPGSDERLGDSGLHEILRDAPAEHLRHPQRIIEAANQRHGSSLPDDVAILVLTGPLDHALRVPEASNSEDVNSLPLQVSA